MQVVTHAMKAAAAGSAASPAALSPIAWLLVEQRGPVGSTAGRYDLTTIELQPAEDGRAQLVDGRMTYPWDRGTTEFWYESSPWALRDGVDPVAAAEAARRGVALLTSAVERAVADLTPFAVGMTTRLPRDADTFEVWLRRDSGERSRYIVPFERTPASVADVQAASRELARVLRANYDRQDPELGATRSPYSSPSAASSGS